MSVRESAKDGPSEIKLSNSAAKPKDHLSVESRDLGYGIQLGNLERVRQGVGSEGIKPETGTLHILKKFNVSSKYLIR